MRKDLADAWKAAKKTDGTIYKNPEPSEIEPALSSDESVLVVLRCLKKWGNLGGGEVCTAVLTDKAVHIFSRGIVKSVNRTHETFHFNTITGVDLARKLTFGWVINMSRASNVDSLLKCEEEGSKKFVSQLKELIASPKTTSVSGSTQISSDPLDKLKKLKDLFDAGVISESEFEEKKQILMDQI